MMQQSMCQQDQLGSQQPLTQQMVLCPVKLVYDTQILVQPGEQIQPNQTIFINPHNPPPWVQNRMQNQVIYVQQVPNNIISNYQHQIDPNTVFLQNYPYQLQQQILVQNPQEQRPVQMGSLPPNMMQGLTNVDNTTNMQNAVQNERHSQVSNFGQIPQQIVPNRQPVPNRQAVPNVVMNQVHNQIHQQTMEVQRPGYINIRHQMAINANIRQQVINPQNISNIQQNIRQTFAPNTSQQRPMQVQNNTANIQRMIQPTYTNSTHVQTPVKVLEQVTTEFNGSNNKPVTSTVSNLKNVPIYAYRPIQPRPQYRHNVPNIGALTQPIAPVQHNVQSNSYNLPKDNRVNNIPYTTTRPSITNGDNRTETQTNRKRKSESPDEIQKKISIINPIVSVNNTLRQSNISINRVATPNEISITRSENNVSNQNIILHLTNNGAQIVKLVDNEQQTNLNETPITKSNNTVLQNSNDKEKLVRNTVFIQARGRLLNDKEIVPNNVNVQHGKSLDNPERSSTEAQNKISVIKIELVETSNTNDNLGTLKNQQEELNKSGIMTDSDVPAKELQLQNETNCGQHILTHVLDGYVIQESNMAFPIRKPLKEKIIYENTKTENFEKDLKEEARDKVKEIKEETVKENKPVDLPQLPFHYLQLDNEKSDAKKEIDKGTPFSTIQPATVKSWTVDNLAKHLTKHGWNEAVSILQEHEIDGESLFLVSKTQLVQIGISEEHADAICEFVRH